MSKKRILMCNEFSRLATGYSRYGYELLSRLYDTDKYEIAEFASYVHFKDERLNSVPWKVYTNMPTGDNQQENEFYNSNQIFQFGSWRFHDVLFDFKPDVVISILDPWMFEHISHSPLRKNFRLLLMPTVDSAPQQESWLAMFSDADGVFTYSDWGLEILKKEGCGHIKLLDSAPPCADINTFFPIMDKKAHKKALGLNDDINIIGTVMRNQKRKLYPDILDAFNQFLKKCISLGNTHLANKTYLYFHTSYPDLGWDIPALIKDYGLSHKVLMTYICHTCGHVFPGFFQDSRAVCSNCGKYQAGLPNTQISASSQVLAAINNLFDIYIQISVAEGFALPLVEAASCGVPVVGVDYSAMEDNVRKLKGISIRVERKYLEAETQAYRVYPDNTHLAEELYKFFNLPEGVRREKGGKARKAVETHYLWGNTAAKWEKGIDDLLPPIPWDAPPDLFRPQNQCPPNLTNEQFVQWAIVNVLGEPERLNTYFALRMCRDLNYGAYIPGYGGLYISDQAYLSQKPQWSKFTREDAINKLVEMRNFKNYLEQRRVGILNEPTKDFILYVKPDAKSIT